MNYPPLFFTNPHFKSPWPGVFASICCNSLHCHISRRQTTPIVSPRSKYAGISTILFNKFKIHLLPKPQTSNFKPQTSNFNLTFNFCLLTSDFFHHHSAFIYFYPMLHSTFKRRNYFSDVRTGKTKQTGYSYFFYSFSATMT
jgi:hypothetical protein